MATTVASLVERVRDAVDDYGDTSTVLAAAVTSTSETDFTLESSDGFTTEDWISVDYETCRVTEVSSGPPYTVTVRRGQRGSTAATHSLGALVLVNPLYPGHRVLSALNSALAKLSKTVKDVATLTVVEDQYAYEVPSSIEVPRRIEIEDSNEDGEFFVIRNWEMLDATHFRIFGSYPDTRNIGVVGTSKFTAMTVGGSLEANFPDTNGNAINFLIYEALGQLLLARQAKIAGRDSFEGMTDAFAQTQPDHSVRVALQYLNQAERYRRRAVAQCPILQPPAAATQNPTRAYLTRV